MNIWQCLYGMSIGVIYDDPDTQKEDVVVVRLPIELKLKSPLLLARLGP